MSVIHKLFKRPLWLLLIVVGVFATGCGVGTAGNWPGITAVGDRVYVAYQGAVVAIDVAERQQVWRYTGGEGGAQFYAPPSVEGDTIILGDFGASGGLFSTGLTVSVYALEEADSGDPTVRWIVDDQITGRVFARPLQIGDRVIVSTSDNHIVALDSNTGTRQWDFQTENAVWSQPAYEDGILYVSALDKNVYAIDAESGDEVWRARLDGGNGSTPVIGHGMLYIGSFDNQLHALDLETGAEVWSIEAVDWVWGSPVLENGTLYFADLQGNVYAADAQTGDGIWQSQVEGSVQAQPVLVGDTLYIGSADSTTAELPKGYLAALSADDGSVLWNAQVPGPVHATPVLVDDALVVAVTNEELPLTILGYNLEDGTEAWSITPTTE